ncbi:MAG TPA: metal-dependent hydrolase [Candidatus Pacearchaeota archaeon]|nr:hypothetical protein BMS3Abin17_00140 [archaeon BMS3Abin17]HDK42342.1 metal-dependent hydrolase [Candidatus Pacearchaeota archaeon]HDZ60288.1 metal-dependent hydrolase [Candidatus Pacearchaeota archaeon]
MILIHLLIGIIFGKIFGNYLSFILGSILPDIDHIYIIIKHKLYNLKKIINSIKYEKKFDIRYKTPLFHSILGLIIFSLIVSFFSRTGAIYFAIAYFIHLLIDLADIDEKNYLYPLKVKFKGFLPIWSKFEKILTIILILILLILYKIN